MTQTYEALGFDPAPGNVSSVQQLVNALSRVGNQLNDAHATLTRLGKSEGILFLSLSPGLVDTSEGKPMSEQAIQGAQAMGALFQQYAPDFKGPITTEQSVEMCLKVIEDATVEKDGGAFVSHFGNKQWL